MLRSFRRILNIITVTMLLLCYFGNVQTVSAEGSITVSTDSLDMYEGDERRFAIRANNAVGSIDISSDDESIARVDIDNVWLDNDSAFITVTAYKKGKCTITVNVTDGATYDEEVINPVYKIEVTVSGGTGPQEVMVPYASINSGEVEEGTKLSLNCQTPDATIYYSINGEMYIEYNDEITLTKQLLNEEDKIELQTFASKDGNYIDSEYVSYTYTLVEAEEDYGELTPEDKELYPDFDSIPEGFWISGLKDLTYNGKAQKQEGIRVYYHTTLLQEKTDYSISYKNNTNVSNNGASIIITGKGNYSGSFSDNFSIRAISISSAVTDDLTLKFNKKEQSVSPKVVLNGKTLKKNTDYTLSVDKLMNVGQYDVTVTGKGNYTGSTSFTVTVTDKKPISEVGTKSIKNITYTGSAYKPEVIFNQYSANGSKIQLVEGVDYTVEYDNDCASAGNHRIVIRALDSSQHVAGTKVLTYKINGISLSSYNNADLVNVTYTGSEIVQADSRLYKKVKNGKQTVKEYLEPEGNYMIAYKNNINTGTATITYTGINGYTGTVKKTFKISQASLNAYNVTTVSMSSGYEYVKGGVTPEPVVKYRGKTLLKDVDYKLSYKNNNKLNDNAKVTITGKGNYSGKIEKEFAISAKNINNVAVVVEDIPAGLVKSKVKFTDDNGKSLGATDYSIVKICYDENIVLKNGTQRYKGEIVGESDSIPANTVLRIYLKGKGNYTGSLSALYKTYEKKISNVKATISPRAYTGKEITLSKDDIVLYDGTVQLNKSDYDIVSYKNNIKKGNATVTIKGKGKYGGLKDLKFKIENRSMYLTVSFDGNGSTSGKMSDQQLNISSALKGNSFKKTGYSFLGWSKVKNGTKVYDDKGFYSYSSTDAGHKVILYAVWAKQN